MKEHNLFHELCMTYLDEEDREDPATRGCGFSSGVYGLLYEMVDSITLTRVLDKMREERKVEKEKAG